MVKLKKLFFSFKNASAGLKVAWRGEQSFRMQFLVGLIVVILMVVLPLSFIERAVLVLAIAAVLGLELLNSQLERILDLIDAEHNVRIKAIKDLSAAAVLTAVLGASAVGILIFLPHLI